MPRNGSGTYSPPVNSWSPATNGVPATASDWQAILNDIRDALTQSVAKDGQTTITGPLQMGGNKLTNLGAGALPGDSLRWEQLFSQGRQADIASAATVDIGAQNTTNLNITGTTTITSFGANYNGPRFLRFAGVLTLTHSAALVLPGSANITTSAGDCAILVPNGSPETGWRVAAYLRSSAPPATTSANTYTGAQTLPGNASNPLEAIPKQQAESIANAAASAAVPSGAVMSFAMNTAPSGWLKCNGALVSRSTYANLFAAIGTTFGSGDGSTTFAVPDMRGEFARAWDDGRGIDPGRAFGSFQSDELKAHTHNYTVWGYSGSSGPGGDNGSAYTYATSSVGGSETRPRNIALLYCIKT